MSAAREDEQTRRPGESYAIYSAHDLLGTLPEEFGTVIGRAAQWPGVSNGDLCAVIERFERRLARLWSRNKRREKAERRAATGGVDDIDDDDDELAENP